MLLNVAKPVNGVSTTNIGNGERRMKEAELVLMIRSDDQKLVFKIPMMEPNERALNSNGACTGARQVMFKLPRVN